jgi:putative N6-adenine-specific DNA methylase
LARVTFGAPVNFFATAAKGTEPALRDELRELRFRGVRADRGGVHFEGDAYEGYRACLWSRIAVRLLTPLASFDAPHERAFYDSVRVVDLSEVLTPKQTLIVSAAVRSSRLTHTEYLSQLTKDAVVDRIRDRTGLRPSVDKHAADVHLFVHLVKDVATLYLDFAGEPLHRRGFRVAGAEAPIKETLAAAVLRYSGWDRRTALADPLCGSGTLLIEAGLWAKNVAPGLSREKFGFERWANFDATAAAAYAGLKSEAKAAVKSDVPLLVGRDASAEAVAQTQEAAVRASLSLDLSVQELADHVTFESAGTIVANPPYGRRLERSAELARELARLVDRHQQSRVALLMASDQPIGHTHRRPEPPREVFNGNIPCVVRSWATRAA